MSDINHSLLVIDINLEHCKTVSIEMKWYINEVVVESRKKIYFENGKDVYSHSVNPTNRDLLEVSEE